MRRGGGTLGNTFMCFLAGCDVTVVMQTAVGASEGRLSKIRSTSYDWAPSCIYLSSRSHSKADLEDGGWRMEVGGWRSKDGGREMEDGG